MRYLLILFLAVAAYACTQAGGATTYQAGPDIYADPAEEGGSPLDCRRILNHNSALEPGADRNGAVMVNGHRFICESAIPEGTCLIVTRWQAWRGKGMLVAERPDGSRVPKLLPENFHDFLNPVTGLKFHAGERPAIVGNGPVVFQVEGYFVEAH